MNEHGRLEAPDINISLPAGLLGHFTFPGIRDAKLKGFLLWRIIRANYTKINSIFKSQNDMSRSAPVYPHGFSLLSLTDLRELKLI